MFVDVSPRNQNKMSSQPPANWIPPEFREFVYGKLTDKEAEDITGTCGYYDGNKKVMYTTEEIKKKFQKIIDVKDKRKVCKTH